MTDDALIRSLRDLPRSLTWRIAEAFQEYRGPDADAEWVKWADVAAVLDCPAPSPEGEGTHACICGRYPHTEACASRPAPEPDSQ